VRLEAGGWRLEVGGGGFEPGRRPCGTAGQDGGREDGDDSDTPHSPFRTPPFPIPHSSHFPIPHSHPALRIPHSAFPTPALPTPHSALRIPHSPLRTPH
jgi:hypothetical protein